MHITSKGQVTIPADIRERAGLLPHTEVAFEYDGKAVRIVRVQARNTDSRSAGVVTHLRGRGDVRMTTDSIMALTRASEEDALNWIESVSEFDAAGSPDQQ